MRADGCGRYMAPGNGNSGKFQGRTAIPSESLSRSGKFLRE